MFRRTLRPLSFAGALSCWALLALPANSQVPPEQQADLILNSARKAYAERNYPFAAERFREFLQKFAGNAKANDARYGLALTLLELPERNYAQVIEHLQPLAGSKAVSDYPFVLYY